MEPVTLGKNFYNSSSLSPTVIIKPEDNVAGVVIRTCTAFGPFNAALITGTTKPTDASDFYTKPALLTLGGETIQLPYPVQLPAGFGLWAIAVNGNIRVSLTYDLLPKS
ncbi:hypothetical protein [Pseudomonas sp. MWU318]|uniref:hypothetical protein n=1 Tax=Pseudomonas sp. MWU318 TaxID=2802569 RepID=UPI001928FC11|nr:hypothetical protein [Pseudomonas sp. MWU318]